MAARITRAPQSPIDAGPYHWCTAGGRFYYCILLAPYRLTRSPGLSSAAPRGLTKLPNYPLWGDLSVPRECLSQRLVGLVFQRVRLFPAATWLAFCYSTRGTFADPSSPPGRHAQSIQQATGGPTSLYWSTRTERSLYSASTLTCVVPITRRVRVCYARSVSFGYF